MIEQGQHVFISGRTGSGKSTLTQQVTEYFPRQVIFDRKGDWKNETGIRVRNFREFASAYRNVFSHDEFRIIIEFSRGASGEHLITESESIVSLIFSIETSGPRRGIGIIYEEIWLYCSPHYVPSWLSEIVLTGRSERISLIANAQRPASVHKNITSQCDHLFIGQYHDPNDAKYFRELTGDTPELRNFLPKHHFLWFSPGGQKPIIITTNAPRLT